jgi:hypothetical protein
MKCNTCGLRSGYNRVLVAVDGGRELGFLCRRCEANQFGETLRDGLWAETEGCALCARDSFVRLPEWSPRLVEENDHLRLQNEYEVTDETVSLCDEHYARLTSRARATGLEGVDVTSRTERP